MISYGSLSYYHPMSTDDSLQFRASSTRGLFASGSCSPGADVMVISPWKMTDFMGFKHI
jgi:hypothetical protein